MSEERDEAGARLLLRELVSEVHQWADWAGSLGADALPAEPPNDQAAQGPSPPPARPGPSAPPAASTPRRPPARPARPTAPAPTAPSEPSPLAALRAELGDCTRCALHQSRKNLVFGVGSESADLVILGEAPGRDEDLTGAPFVGRSGQLLTRMLAAIGLHRDQVYISNVLKCRPPQNRDPAPDEIATCSPFMIRQVHALEPRVVMTLGRFASQRVLGSEDSMGRLRGQTHLWEGLPVVPSYHPAYLLRNPVAKREAWDDLLRVRALLNA